MAGEVALGFAENHRIQIPEGCHWTEIRQRTTNVGRGIQVATSEIEKANPQTL